MISQDLRGSRRTPGRCGLAVLALGLSAVGLRPAVAATVGDEAAARSAEALEHYNGGRFAEAVDQYRQAQIEDPDSPELLFNVGDALYKQGDFEAAGRAFQEASASPALAAPSFYNLGNTLFQKQAYPQAVEAYKEAITRGFDDEAGKANLELALRMQHEQQQEQQQQQQQQQQGEQPEESEGADPGEEGEREREQEPGQDEPAEERDRQGGQEGESPQPPQAPEEEEPQPQGEHQLPGQMQPDEAEQLLDAFADREQEAQRRRFRVEARTQVKDW